jgi:hypothetical protein
VWLGPWSAGLNHENGVIGDLAALIMADIDDDGGCTLQKPAASSAIAPQRLDLNLHGSARARSKLDLRDRHPLNLAASKRTPVTIKPRHSMWNSPSGSKDGKRYAFEEIRVLAHPLANLLETLQSMHVKDVVDEEILQQMDKEELIYAIYEVLHALLNSNPVPNDGHPGYQEAIIAELLNQTHTDVIQELKDSQLGSHARMAAWHSYERLCATIDPAGNKSSDLFPDLELDLANPRVYESPEITEEMWQDILIGDGGLWGEFLWDNDWRLSGLMDLPKRATKPITDLTGIDLEVVHRLAHTPSKAELRMAEYYIKYVIWSDEVIGLRQKRGT